MQAPSSLHDFPHAPPSTSNRRIQPEFLAETSHLQQQLEDQKMFAEEQPPNNHQRPGVTTNFLYKLTELAAYTVAAAAEAYQTMAGENTKEYPQQSKQKQQQQNNFNNRYSMAFDGYGDDIMQIKAGVDEDTEMIEEEDMAESPEIESSKKSPVYWSNLNADEEEPPPPYDSSWAMPNVVAKPASSELPRINTTEPQLIGQRSQDEPQAQSISSSPTSGTSRRRQIRVRRGTRPIRRKSSSTSLNATAYQSEDGEEDMFLKFNGKLADMISEGRAALTSTVDVTDVEVMLAEEREREERIRRDIGLPTQSTRRHRRMTSSSSASGEYDYFTNHSPSDSNSYLNTTTIDHSCGSHTRSESPTSYSSPSGYSSTPGTGYLTTQTRYGSPNTYGTSIFGGSTLGSALTSMNASTLGSAFASNTTKNLGSTTSSLYGTSSITGTPYRSASILGTTYGGSIPSIIGSSGLGYASNSATSSGVLGRESSINGSGSGMFSTRKYY